MNNIIFLYTNIEQMFHSHICEYISGNYQDEIYAQIVLVFDFWRGVKICQRRDQKYSS